MIRHRTRLTTASLLAPILPGDMYSAYSLSEEEYIGRFDGNLKEARGALSEKGYKYNMLGAKKLHPETEKVDDGSFRNLDPDDNSKQWHVHIWETDNGVQFFSHYEYKPEPWRPIDIARPFEHYRPDYGETYIQGQHSRGIKEVLKGKGVYDGKEKKLGSRDLAPTSRG